MRWLKTGIFEIILLQAFGFENLSLMRPAWQSSTYSSDTPASKAVDGSMSKQYPHIALTNFETSVWWYVDLGAPSNIHNITIYYRAESFVNITYFRKRFAEFSLFISNVDFTTRGGYDCGVNSTDPPTIYPAVCMRVGRYVTIYNQRLNATDRFNRAILELGEVQVFGCRNASVYGVNCNLPCSSRCKNRWCNIISGSCLSCNAGLYGHNCDIQCPSGYYGSQCSLRCSNNCKNGPECDPVTGNCDHGCKDGYYGLKCFEICSGNCKNNTVCDKSTGVCTNGCAAGWKTSQCFKVCDPFEYGDNCALQCGDCKNGTCNRMSGQCESGCGPGYTGKLCKTDCQSGLHGENCLQNCSGNCWNSEPCNHKTGACDAGCSAGYTGTKCDTKCDSGRYGVNCSQFCSSNCKDPKLCHHATGVCNFGCVDGYYSGTCSVRCSGYCHGNALCNSSNGFCERGCTAGWNGNKCDTECTPGLYGENCVQTCSGHCYGNTHCNAVNGYCEDGCDKGWSGVRCNLAINDDSQLGVGMASGAGVIVALITAVAIGFCIVRKCRQKKENPETKQPGSEKDLSTVYYNEALSRDKTKNGDANEGYQELSDVSNNHQSNQYESIVIDANE